MRVISSLKDETSRLIARTPLQFIPVRVRKGLAKGARWTMFPSSSYWRGNTEQDVEAAIRSHGNIHGSVCWDLGTHFGIYTVGMAMAVGREGQVVGFEPNPESFSRCRRHVSMNKLDWVRLYQAAASDSDGFADLLPGSSTGSSGSHFAYEDEQLKNQLTKLRVRTIVIDELVDSREIRPAHFIKVDVEGHGAKALLGARRFLASYRPTLVMSFHSKWELEGTQDLMEPLGYRSFTCDGQELGWPSSIYRTAVLHC